MKGRPIKYDYTPEDIKRAEANGISQKVFIERIYRGKTVDQAINETLMKRNRSKKRMKYQKIAVENGISPNTYRSRLTRGWTYEQAAEAEPKRRRRIPDHIREQADANAIPYKVLHARLTLGWSPERAATEPIDKRDWKKPKRQPEVAMPDDEVLAVVGRIKYLNKRDFKEFPVTVPKPMLQRMQEIGMNIEKVEEVEV